MQWCVMFDDIRAMGVPGGYEIISNLNDMYFAVEDYMLKVLKTIEFYLIHVFITSSSLCLILIGSEIGNRRNHN